MRFLAWREAPFAEHPAIRALNLMRAHQNFTFLRVIINCFPLPHKSKGLILRFSCFLCGLYHLISGQSVKRISFLKFQDRSTFVLIRDTVIWATTLSFRAPL